MMSSRVGVAVPMVAPVLLAWSSWTAVSNCSLVSIAKALAELGVDMVMCGGGFRKTEFMVYSCGWHIAV